MKKISETELITTCIEDFYSLKSSPKNRSSFANREDGVKHGCSRFVTLRGEKRVKDWAKYLNENKFSELAYLPVWDNGDGSYFLGDGHTRCAAIKALYESGKIKEDKIPQVSLMISNHKFESIEDFFNSTRQLNEYSGQKWDIADKIDSLAREGNKHAQFIIDCLDKVYEKTGKDIAPNLMCNIVLDKQGVGKETNKNILFELSNAKEINKYSSMFIDFFCDLVEKIKNSKCEVKLNLHDQYIGQSIFNLFMCVAPMYDETKVLEFKAKLGSYVTNSVNAKILKDLKKPKDIASKIIDKMPNTEWHDTMSLVRTDRGMTKINSRGGRCFKLINENEE